MHPLLMPLLMASLLGNPAVSRVSAGETFRTQLQPHCLASQGAPSRPLPLGLVFACASGEPHILMTGPASAPVSRPFPTDKLQPKWTGAIAGYGLSVTPRRESGGFKVDVELSW